MPAKKSPVSKPKSANSKSNAGSNNKSANSTVAKGADKPQRRARRSTETVKHLILQAARELFSERGYSGATTREIAQRADTNEVLLFRHFTSKAQLFEQAVFEPCQGFVEEFSRKHPPTAMHTSTETAREFVAGLYNVFYENRRLMMALIAASLYEPEITRSLAQIDAMRDYYKAAENYVRQEGSESSLGIGTGVRLSFSLVAAAVLFEDWMFAGVRRPPSRQRMIEDLSAFIVHGFAGSPVATASEKTGKPPRTSAAAKPRPRRKPSKSTT